MFIKCNHRLKSHFAALSTLLIPIKRLERLNSDQARGDAPKDSALNLCNRYGIRARSEISGKPLPAKWETAFLRNDIVMHFTVQYVVHDDSPACLAFYAFLSLPRRVNLVALMLHKF